MQSIDPAKLLSALSSASSRPLTNGLKIDADDERAAKVWKTLAEIFGPSFYKSFGSVPPPIWLSTISSLSDEECVRGFTAIAAASSDFAPNLPQFIAYCKGTKDVPSSPRFLGAPIDPHKLKTLGAPVEARARVEDVEDWLGSMRENVTNAEIKVNPAYLPPVRKSLPKTEVQHETADEASC